MVVISAALLSKNKTLVARQFVEISRLRIEGLLSAFLRLIESGSKDHTYIETEAMRYVYLPIEALYLVLITNKHSNILEDLETLKLMQQVVQSCCESPVNEDNVLAKAFDIVFALDEIISFGYRESVTLSQIKAYTEMESHDEKLSILVLKEKMKEERKRGQQIASRLDKERKERMKQQQAMLQAQSKLQQQSIGLAPVPTTEPITTEISPSSTTTGAGAFEIPTTTPLSGSGGGFFPGKGMELGRKKPAASELLSVLRSGNGINS